MPVVCPPCRPGRRSRGSASGSRGSFRVARPRRRGRAGCDREGNWGRAPWEGVDDEDGESDEEQEVGETPTGSVKIWPVAWGCGSLGGGPACHAGWSVARCPWAEGLWNGEGIDAGAGNRDSSLGFSRGVDDRDDWTRNPPHTEICNAAPYQHPTPPIPPLSPLAIPTPPLNPALQTFRSGPFAPAEGAAAGSRAEAGAGTGGEAAEVCVGLRERQREWEVDDAKKIAPGRWVLDGRAGGWGGCLGEAEFR